MFSSLYFPRSISIFKTSSSILLTPLILFMAFPLIFIIYSKTLLYRYLLSKIFNYRTLNRKLLTSGSTFHSSNNFSTVLLPFILEGTPDINVIRKEFQEKIILAKDSFGGLLYPELQQKIVTIWGYHFWENCSKFDIKHHVKLLNGVDSLDLHSPKSAAILTQLCQVAWKNDRPKWELYIIPNAIFVDQRAESTITTAQHFLILFRWDHALCDAYSVIKMFDNIHTPKITYKLVTPNYPSTFENFKSILITPFVSAYDIAWVTVNLFPTAIQQRLDMVTNNTGEIELSREISHVVSDSLSMKDLKLISCHYGVTLTSLLMTMLCGGLRQNAINQGIKVTRDVVLNFVLPVPHSLKLRNQATFGFIKLPISEPCPKKRLLSINKQLQQIKNSSIPWTIWKFNMITGSQPPWILSRLINSAFNRFSINLTNIQWAPEPISMFGYPLKEIHSGGVFDWGGARSVIFYFVSYNKQGKLNQVCDASLFNGNKSDSDCSQLIQSCLQELEVLKKMSITTDDIIPELIISRL